MSTVKWIPNVLNMNQAQGTVIIGTPGSGKAVWEDSMVDAPCSDKDESEK